MNAKQASSRRGEQARAKGGAQIEPLAGETAARHTLGEDAREIDPLSQTPLAQLWRPMGAMARLAALPIYAYRYLLSPFVGHTCRHQPTCSAYALEALARHGARKGLSFTARRLMRCHPWGSSGYDPVPHEKT